MAYVLVHHKVEDYNNWKAHFENNSELRSRNGSKGGKVFQSADNPNELFILLEWDSFENAKKFTGSDELKEVMKEAGVVTQPEIYFVEDAADTTA